MTDPDSLLLPLSFAVGALFLAWAVNVGLLANANRVLTIDTPNSRSLHARPTPRGGGIGIALAFFLVAGGQVAWRGDFYTLTSLFLPLAAIVAVSHLDDRRSLSPGPRLLVHLGAAVWFVLLSSGLERISLPGIAIPLGVTGGGVFSVLLLVWLTNLYNFMDGMDGFAGGMAVIGFGVLGALSHMGGDATGALLAWCAAGGSAGFLVLNFPPARLFMGDVGSLLLGFLAGALVIRAEHQAAVPAWIGLLVFSPFAVDATVTVVRRAVRGDRVWQPHRTHYYQQLVRLGWGHRRTVLVEYALMLACAVSAWLGLGLPATAQWWLMFGWAVIFTILMRLVTRLGRGAAIRGERVAQ